jgi:hypothetical protein
MPVNAGLVNSNYFGNPGLVIEILGEINTDLYGLSTGTLTAKCPQNRFDLVPPLFSYHPVFTYLNVERQRIQIKDGFLWITLDYAGILGGQTEPIYELCLGLGEEPIETHPNFVVNVSGSGDGQPLAGKPSAPYHGAYFVDSQTGRKTTDDATGVFDRFQGHLDDGSPNPFAGISSYLEFSQAVWRKRWYATFRPSDIIFLGKVMSPEGPAPALGGNRNWIYQSLNYEQRGIVYGITKEWKASGFRGWNPNIYG